VTPVPVTMPAIGPLRLFAKVRSCVLAAARARRRAGRSRGSKGLPRCAGCPAVLAFGSCRITRFACFAALRSNRMRQVRSRSARVRAPTQSLALQAALGASAQPLARHKQSTGLFVSGLASSAAPIRPACAPPVALPATGSVCRAAHAAPGSATRHPGRAQRACEALRSTGLLARARTRALRELTRRVCSSAVSAANVASYAAGPPSTGSGRSVPSTSSGARAPQGSRSEAKTASPVRWARPGCLVAAQLPAKRRPNGSNGPKAEDHLMRRWSREARWSHCDG